jgi:phytoene synthase
MDENYHHCEALVRAADKDRFLATLFAPAGVRGPLFALYAFDIEIASVRDRAREPMPGEIRLQWWRDVLNGERAGEAAANPVAAALVETIAQFNLSAARLLDLIEAHAFDLYDDPMPTFNALLGYLGKTSVTIFECAATICGGTASDAVELVGVSYGITAFLRAFALHASRHQLFLPLMFFGGGTTAAEAIFAGRLTPDLIDVLELTRKIALRRFEVFERDLAALPALALPALLPVALVPVYLSAMEQPGYDPFKSVAEVPQWRRQWALWRAARRWSRVMRG